MFEAMLNVCWAESLKLRRSRALPMTLLAGGMVPVAAALFARDDWSSYFSGLAMAGALGSMIVFGLFVIWIFGREHADRTSKELLTLPVPREAIVLGKLVVAGAWCMALQAFMLLEGLLLGLCLGLPFWSLSAFGAGAGKGFLVAALTFCLVTPLGLAANLSRGTLGAVGVLFLLLFFGALLTALGWGAYFPWAVPALASAPGPGPGAWSLGAVALAGLAGVLGNMAWWRSADQH